MKFWKCAAAWLLCGAMLPADEGKWTPQQLLQFDPQWLKQQGLELPLSRLWDAGRGTGLLAAAVSVPGCSAGFVSATGLLLTNHHCLFGILQQHSRPGRDLIADGFLAKTQDEELPGRTTRVTVPRKFTDVTRTVEAAVPRAADDLSRRAAIETTRKSLVAECEKTAGARCSVEAFDGGLQYVLIETIDLTDVRLVYAPPRGVGEFGGEVDNFRWPRHTGDFAMARVYRDGKPYTPEFHFPIARDGVKPGDFVMVMGYPGRTFRAMTSSEMANERDFRFQLRKEVYGEWIRLLEETTKNSPDGALAVAATLKSLANSHTNALGQLAGLARGRLIENRKQMDDAVVAWAARQGAFGAAMEAKKELDRLSAVRRETATRDFLFQVVRTGSLALKHATILVELARERAKPDAERLPEYQNRQWTSLRATLERDQASFYRAADEAVLIDWMTRASKLGPRERIAAVDAVNGSGGIKAAVANWYESTRVTDLRERRRMFDETTDQLRARRDPLLDFAFAIEPEARAWTTATQTYDGAVARLRPEWRRAVIAHAGKAVAPDANSTLRVSFAHVKGYVPRDGIIYTPQTTLAGMLEKETGEEPFSLPAPVRDAARRDHPERVPLNFLADADTTGGNSGSPVLNGRGELVGLNFDRVWENVANDFGYNPDVARNISVDVRFLLWLLKGQPGGDAILRELGAAR